MNRARPDCRLQLPMDEDCPRWLQIIAVLELVKVPMLLAWWLLS